MSDQSDETMPVNLQPTLEQYVQSASQYYRIPRLLDYIQQLNASDFSGYLDSAASWYVSDEDWDNWGIKVEKHRTCLREYASTAHWSCEVEKIVEANQKELDKMKHDAELLEIETARLEEMKEVEPRAVEIRKHSEGESRPTGRKRSRILAMLGIDQDLNEGDTKVESLTNVGS